MGLSILIDYKETAMIDMYDEEIEKALLVRMHEHQAAKQVAERKLAAARNVVVEEEEAIAHWQFAVEDYRKAHGLPARSTNPSPVLEAEFAHMGPTELVQYWADKYDDEVVVKDLAKVAVNAGVFPNYRHGSSTIYAVVKRKGFEKLGPGHFKRIHTSRKILVPSASSEPIVVSSSHKAN